MKYRNTTCLLQTTLHCVFSRVQYRKYIFCLHVKDYFYIKQHLFLREKLQHRSLQSEIVSILREKTSDRQRISIGRSTGLNGFRNSANGFALLQFFRNQQRYSTKLGCRPLNGVSAEIQLRKRTRERKMREKRERNSSKKFIQ